MAFRLRPPLRYKKDFNNGDAYFSYLAKAGYGSGVTTTNFDDRTWRTLNLPHDWAIEQPFSSSGSFSHGFKAIGKNFPERSVGWYRKSFIIPNSDFGRRISIAFDGVFRNSIAWLNGHYLGTEESGYLGFEYDITDYLNYGGNNTISVRTDVTLETGWFYEGAGIYRHVWLNKTNPLHVATNGSFVTTKVNGNSAAITVAITLQNNDKSKNTFDVVQAITNADGKAVAKETQRNLSLKSIEEKEFSSTIHLSISKTLGYRKSLFV